MKHHLWTAADLARWRAFIGLAGQAHAQVNHHGRANVPLIAALARQCRKIKRVPFPTRDRQEWSLLTALVRAANEYAIGGGDGPVATEVRFLELLTNGRRILDTSPDAPRQSAPMTAAWWTEN